jgi:hypothetical protein
MVKEVVKNSQRLKRVKIMKGLSHIKVKMGIMKTIRLMRDPPY